jgi:predicted MFS family arabinose efflux permease
LVLISLAFGFIADAAGYQVIFLVIAGLLLVPLWFVSRVREPAQRTPAHSFDRRAFRVMLQPRYLLLALFLILAWFFFQGIDGLVTYYMSDTLESSSRTIGIYGTLKGAGMVIGALAVSRIVARLGRAAAALITVGAVLAGGLMLSALHSEKALLAVAVLWGIVVGLQWTSYVTMEMGVTDTRIAGAMFAILQTMGNIGIGAGEGVATALTDNLGFPAVFRLLALANLILIPLILLVTRRFRAMWERPTGDLVADAG